MRIGILSDSHGQHERVARALRILEDAGATRFIHCGDVGGEAVLDALAGRTVALVWGNTDLECGPLGRYATALGLEPAHEIPLELHWQGKHLAVFHGHEPQFRPIAQGVRLADFDLIEQAVGGADYVFHGHTHIAADDHYGRVRIINPGALYRASTYTCCVLDLDHSEARHLEVPA